jgi:hypothetical protein
MFPVWKHNGPGSSNSVADSNAKNGSTYACLYMQHTKERLPDAARHARILREAGLKAVRLANRCQNSHYDRCRCVRAGWRDVR